MSMLLSAFALTLLGSGEPAPRPTPSETVQPKAQGTFVVQVTEDGGLDAITLRTLASMVRAELRKAGFRVDDDAQGNTPRPLDPATLATLTQDGRRVASLRVMGRLGQKVPLSLEEVDSRGQVLHTAAMTAGRLEEADLIIPRLVESVIKRVAPDTTARYATVTEAEAREPLKRPGTGHFAMGIPMITGSGSNPQGLSLGYLYTAQTWMLGLEGFSAINDRSGVSSPLFLHAAWLPSDGPVSVYVGGGIGILTVKEEGEHFDSGMGVRASVGMECFRLHRMRLQVGADIYLPLGSRSREVTEWHGYDKPPTNRTISAAGAYTVLQVRVAF